MIKPPPLPDTDPDKVDSWYYTVDQMHAHARAAMQKMREECAKVCETNRYPIMVRSIGINLAAEIRALTIEGETP